MAIGNEFLDLYINNEDLILICISGGLTRAELINIDSPEDALAFMGGRIRLPRIPIDHTF